MNILLLFSLLGSDLPFTSIAGNLPIEVWFLFFPTFTASTYLQAI